jgi:23S rRNA pseudouridine1911/1915/1917 synthase
VTEARRIKVVVAPAEAGARLDQWLAARVPDLSRRRARVLLDLGGVFVDGRRTKVASRPMRAGETVVLNLGGALAGATNRTGRDARAADEARLPTFQVVFEDEDLVVVDKPAGLLTAPTPESDRNNLQSLLSRRTPGAPATIFVVHRIDLPTSGLLVFAKTNEANEALSERFRTHDLERAYLAVVDGAFPQETRLLDGPVGGRRARTHVEVLERYEARATLLRCRLETGRTHQIRIHCRDAGHPVLGDSTYGRRTAYDPPRLALHATHLGFAHPRTGAAMAFDSPWPADLTPWRDALRDGGELPTGRPAGP